MCYCEFPTIQVCVLISISLLLWQWACASAGDEPALHRFSLHAAHLGEVHTLLILHLMTFDPVIWLLNTLELDQTRIEQLYAHSSIFFPSLLQTHTHIHILNLYASFKLHGLHLSLMLVFFVHLRFKHLIRGPEGQPCWPDQDMPFLQSF